MATHLHTTRRIEAPAAQVWALLADYGNIARFNPNIERSMLLDGGPARGVGALRQCDAGGGRIFVRERVTRWDEGRSYTVEIYEGSMPVDDNTATLTVEPLGDGACEVRMEMRYTARYGALGALLNALVLRPMMRRAMRKLLVGIEAEAARPALAAPALA